MAFTPPPAPPKFEKPGRLPTTNAALSAQIASAERQISSLPGLFNPQRQALAAETARGLTDAGLFERASIRPINAGSGSTTYGIDSRFQGQAYRDLTSGIMGAAASRGTGRGSAAARQLRLGTKNLTNQAQGALRQFGNQQADITRAQSRELQGLDATRAAAVGGLADFQAQTAFQQSELDRAANNQQLQANYGHGVTIAQMEQTDAAQTTAADQFRETMDFNREQANLAGIRHDESLRQQREFRALPR